MNTKKALGMGVEKDGERSAEKRGEKRRPGLQEKRRPGLQVALALLLAIALLPATATAESSVAADASGAADAGAPAPAAADTPAPSAAPSSAAAASKAPALVKEREEVVYALLEGNGRPQTGYVVNHFLVDEGGTLVDEGGYSSATNLSSLAELSLEGTQVSVPVDKGDFYYEGVLDTVDLPWLIDIDYTLDGKKVEPAQLAGASGKLGLNIKTRMNPDVDAVFFENYLLQIQVTLDAGTTRALHAPDATIATVGTNKQLVFMVLPGREGDLALEAQVTDFEMPGIQVSALPFSMVFDIPDTDTMVTDMRTLTDAIKELDEGVRKLNGGATDLESGSAALASGSNGLNDALRLVSDNSAGLRDASSQIKGALALIAKELKGGTVDPDQVEQLVDGLRQLSAGLHSDDPKQPGLANGLTQMHEGLTGAVTAMDGVVGTLAPVTDPAALQALGGELGLLSPGSQATAAALIEVNTQAAYVQGAWYGPGGNDGVKAGLDSIAAGLDQSADTCQTLAGQIATIGEGLEQGLSGVEGLGTLGTSLGTLSDNYTAFDKGLAGYLGGVDRIAAEYATFNSALGQVAGGIREFSGGVSTLRTGTSELYANVEDLPETMQKEIDGFLKDYQASAFEPVSFVSAANEKTTRVQFVLRTDPIEAEAPEKPADDSAPAPQGLWDRLLALFA
ncbi:MAG: hypothetical protein LBL86_05055 [Coriobacteriales bacterium]|nr:hypothetical protein [Coriobacteriales bacterium]